MNWKLWAMGILHAAISGGVNAVSSMIVAPDQFNLGDGLPRVLSMAGVGALLGVVLYLKQSPLPPGWDGVDRRG